MSTEIRYDMVCDDDRLLLSRTPCEWWLPSSIPVLSTLAILVCGLPKIVTGDGTYRSRPDLSPPRMNVTIPCDDRCEQGFLFVAPFVGYADPENHGPKQPAPYILTDTGDLVWSGFTYFSIWAGNFQAARWRGKDVLFAFEGAHNSLHGHGHGHHTFFDQNYQNIRELRAGNHMLSDKHEFIVVNETSALIQIYHPMQMDLRPYGGVDGQTWIVDARFQELDIETGKVLFEWSSLEHTTPDETALPLPRGRAGFAYNSSTAWDYFHINSIEKGNDGHYLISSRHASTIFKVNGTDGSIIWRLGGKYSNFELGPNVTFGFQHHARYMGSTDDNVDYISFFDNSVYGSEAAGGGDLEVHLYPYSRGKYIKLDHVSGNATLELALLPPQAPILTKSQGSNQVLPNGNALINWGSEGQISEYDSEGKPLFHAFLDSGSMQSKLQNYRAFRYNWTGFSPETPAVFAEKSSSGVDIYVSWNGDTQTETWRFGWQILDGKSVVIRSANIRRTGFETRFTVPSAETVGKVWVEAIDVSGRTLTVSKNVSVVQAFWESTGQQTKRPEDQQVLKNHLGL